MNVYVDKLPESCERCPCNDDYYRCGLSGDLFDLNNIYAGRMKNCKLKKLADVVEVVRCKDCRWYEINELKSDGTEDKRYKPSMCVLHSRSFRDNYYCADGERADT